MEHCFLISGIALAAFCLFVVARDDGRFLRWGSRRTKGTVYDHRRTTDEGSDVFAPKIRFPGEDGRPVEIVDAVLRGSPSPPVGTEVAVVHPKGAPEAGRVPRPWLRLVIYAALLFTLAILLARLLGLIA